MYQQWKGQGNAVKPEIKLKLVGKAIICLQTYDVLFYEVHRLNTPLYSAFRT